MVLETMVSYRGKQTELKVETSTNIVIVAFYAVLPFTSNIMR